MADDVHMLAYSAMLAWVMIMAAAAIRTNGSIVLMFSNRDGLPPPTAVSERADRAVRNMLENLVLFVALWVAAKSTNAQDWKLLRGAQMFFFARVVYFPLYLAGVKVARTAAWAVGVAGMGLLATTALT